MTYIDELIKDNCPNGVEWKELGEVCEIQRGVRITKKQLLPSGYPVVSGGTGYMGYTDNYNREAETITIAQYGVAGYVNIQKEKFWANDVCFSVYPKDILVNKYLYYVLANKQEYLYSISNRTAVPYSISKDKILKIKIPIPPLKIQEEIVKILDKFTEYVTELTAELTFRQKQYSYYRDRLLSFEDQVYQVEWKTLGEVAGFRRGSFPQPYGEKEWYGGENSQPFVQVADISENGYCLNASTQKRISQKAIPKSVFVPKGTVLVTLQGTIGRVAVTQYDAYVDRTIAIFDDYKCDIDIKYFAYQLKRKFDIEKEFARGSTLKTITKQEFSQFQIPIPPLPIQQRIVEVLDNFDAVCNDLNIGLPKEIELRKKQYEYFREKLLTFTAEGVYTDSTVQYSTVQTRPD